MQLTLLVATLFASAASARVFTIYSNSNFWGLYEVEKRGNDNTCWNLNGKGDSASSVRGDGCSTFYRDRDCQGGQWQQSGAAATVPDFLENHIWSYRNQC